MIKESKVTSILNKKQMYKLYEAGEFGNRWPCWKTLKEWFDSGYKENINFRYKGSGSGGFVHYNMERENAVRTYCKLLLEGVKALDIHITGGDNGMDRCLNGEIGLLDGLPYLLYSTVNKVMRAALKEESHIVEGDLVLDIIKKYMDENSYKNLIKLFKQYPNHAIEFTCYNKPVGTLNWNSVYWEVRQY